MSQLVIEGFTVRVARGSRVDTEQHGDTEPAWSGRMRSDVRAEHRVFDIETVEMDSADALALRLLLQSPGPLECTGDLVGESARDFHRRGPVTVEPLTGLTEIVRFQLRETQDTRTSDLLFSFDGDALGSYTFTRSGSVGPYVDEDGVLQNAAADTVRVDYVYNATTGLYEPTLLLEAARTNELTQSEDLTHADWTKAATSIVANQATGPDNMASLDEIVEDGTTAQHSVRQALTGMTADADYALSGWFVANTRSWVRLQIFESATPANLCQAWFNLSTGAVGTSSAGGTGAVTRAYVEDWTHLSAGLYRCALVGSVGNSATSVSGVALLATGDTITSYAGDGSSSIYGGYLQIEDDTGVASSYVATTTAADTRNDDTFYADFLAAPQEMTVYVKFRERGTVLSGGGQRLFQIGAAGAATDPRFMVLEDSGVYRVLHDNGTTLPLASLAAAPSYGDLVEIRAVLNADGSVVIGQSIAGAAETTASDATTATLGSAWAGTRLYLSSAGPTLQGFNAFESVKIAKGTKTLAEMRSLAPARLWARD